MLAWLLRQVGYFFGWYTDVDTIVKNLININDKLDGLARAKSNEFNYYNELANSALKEAQRAGRVRAKLNELLQ